MIGLVLMSLLASPWSDPSPVWLVAAPAALNTRERAAWATACADSARALGGPPIPRGAGRWRLHVVRALDPGDFAAQTGRARFEAAAVSGDQLFLQSRATLARFPGLAAVRRHECVHAWLRAAGIPPLPVILEEVLAVGISGQAAGLPPATALDEAALPTIRAALRRPRSRAHQRAALARAVQTFWPPLRALKPADRRRFLQRLADAPTTWLRQPLPTGGTLADALQPPSPMQRP